MQSNTVAVLYRNIVKVLHGKVVTKNRNKVCEKIEES